jgi:hypothetical protein
MGVIPNKIGRKKKTAVARVYVSGRNRVVL